MRVSRLTRSFTTTRVARQQPTDLVQKLYLDALKAYKPSATASKPDLAEKFEAPIAPPPVRFTESHAVSTPRLPDMKLTLKKPVLEAAEVAVAGVQAGQDGEIVLVNPDDFAPYLDPCEDPNDYDSWWDYTVDYDVYPVCILCVC